MESVRIRNAILRDSIFWIRDKIKRYRPYEEVAKQTEAAGRAARRPGRQDGVAIKFLGLWDTVEAYGIPIAGLKRGIDLMLWPMVFDNPDLSPCVKRACHALSLDDERLTFRSLVWDEEAEAKMVAKGDVVPGRITQVWFPGVHSNVGGGYPEDQLSLVSLEWMMGEAMASGLVLDSKAVKDVGAAQSPYARLYDSREGLAAYYRYARRRIEIKKDNGNAPILPIIHGSVVMRMAYGPDDYSPIILPNEFWVMAPDGALLPMERSPKSLSIDATKKLMASVPPTTKTSNAIATEKAKLKDAIQQLRRPDPQAIELVRDTVFWRQCLFFFTGGLTVIFAAYPLLGGLFTNWALALVRSIPVVGADLADWLGRLTEVIRGPITSLIDALSGFIASYAGPWTNVLEKYPVESTLILVLIVLSLVGSSRLQMRIHERVWFAWQWFAWHK